MQEDNVGPDPSVVVESFPSFSGDTPLNERRRKRPLKKRGGKAASREEVEEALGQPMGAGPAHYAPRGGVGSRGEAGGAGKLGERATSGSGYIHEHLNSSGPRTRAPEFFAFVVLFAFFVGACCARYQRWLVPDRVKLDLVFPSVLFFLFLFFLIGMLHW